MRQAGPSVLPLRQGQGSCSPCGANHAVAHLIRKAYSQLIQDIASYLQNLDFQHDLRFRKILGCHQAFGHAHRIGRVAHHHHVQLLVDVKVLGLNQGLDHVGCDLCIRVGQVERANDKILVVALLGLRSGVNQYGVLVEHLAFKLIAHKYESEDFVYACISNKYRGSQIRPNIPIKDKI
ncbi:MAG: hypothetical protein IPK29_15280 [Betaproteobacteria bacterium]|nr:hypothetical protein [Betaproteobacteria bacterium]